MEVWKGVVGGRRGHLCLHNMGSRDGAVLRGLASYHCGLGSIPGPDVTCGLGLLLEDFFSLSSIKTNIFNSNSASQQ